MDLFIKIFLYAVLIAFLIPLVVVIAKVAWVLVAAMIAGLVWLGCQVTLFSISVWEWVQNRWGDKNEA